MAKAEHHRHQAPVDRSGRAQKIPGVAAQHHAHRDPEKCPHRNENQEQVVPVHADPEVLQRHAQVHPEQHASIGAARRNQREIFLEREKRQDREETDRDAAPERDRHREHEHQHPPRTHARGEFGVAVAGVAAAHQPDDRCRHDQQDDDRAQRPQHRGRNPEVQVLEVHALLPPQQSVMRATVSCARARMPTPDKKTVPRFSTFACGRKPNPRLMPTRADVGPRTRHKTSIPAVS